MAENFEDGIRWLVATGLMDEYVDRIAVKMAEHLRKDLWNLTSDALPDEDRELFFMTARGGWAGERVGTGWHDSFDGEQICTTDAVIQWQYAPENVTVPIARLGEGLSEPKDEAADG